MSIEHSNSGSREVIPHEEWLEQGKEHYGEDFGDWEFRCLNCGNIQSIKSVVSRNPELKGAEVALWIGCACEGRHTKGIGCDWALFGLFQIHEKEVVIGDKRSRAFPFAFEPLSSEEIRRRDSRGDI